MAKVKPRKKVRAKSLWSPKRLATRIYCRKEISPRDILLKAFNACGTVNECEQCEIRNACVNWFAKNLDRYPNHLNFDCYISNTHEN